MLNLEEKKIVTSSKLIDMIADQIVKPQVPRVFDKFPDNYINDINGWAFDKETIESNAGKMLTMDIDFGSYCSLNCPFCFRLNNSIDDAKRELQYDDLTKLILDAKKIGLRSVKFLGKGDPFENKKFLDFLRFLHSLDIIPLVFTKGHVIGDDAEVFRYYSSYGIYSSFDLAKELKRLNVSIMLGFNSFSPDKQNRMVGRKNSNYTQIRNRALEILVEAGLNSDVPTSLALAINPITIWNYDEVLEVYKWGRLRNLYCIVTPSMISGRAKDKTWVAITPNEKEIEEIYTEIYKFNIETNLQTKDQILDEGVSAYAGGHPCNQVSTGLYVSLNGVVLSCPGSEENVEGNIWENSISEIWDKSMNRKLRAGKFNCKCIAKDGKSIHSELYNNVTDLLNE